MPGSAAWLIAALAASGCAPQAGGAGVDPPAPPAVASHSMVELGEADAGAERAVAVGTQVIVRLPARLGTGYSWRRADAEAGVANAAEPIVEAAQIAPGDPEIQRFTLRVTAAGRHVLRFVYEQPFAGGHKNARTITYTIEAR